MNNMMSFLLNMMRSGGNPEQVAMQLLQQQGNNPMSQNLMSLAQKEDSAGLEQIARNLCKQRGIDFDSEFRAFKQQLGFK